MQETAVFDDKVHGLYNFPSALPLKSTLKNSGMVEASASRLRRDAGMVDSVSELEPVGTILQVVNMTAWAPQCYILL